MKVIWGDKSREYPNVTESVEPMLAELAKWKAEGESSVQTIRIDGIEVHDDYESYVRERIDTIETIELVTLSVEQAIQQLCSTAASYLDRAIPQLELLYGDFYRGAANEAWERLAEGIDGMLWLYDTCESVSAVRAEEADELRVFQSKVTGMLPDFESAVADRDAITIGDLLQHEAVPAYRELQSSVGLILGRLVVGTDVS